VRPRLFDLGDVRQLIMGGSQGPFESSPANTFFA